MTNASNEDRPYVIGSGWFCDGTGQHEGSVQKHMQSSDESRKEAFHKIWYHFIDKYADPSKIIIVDSNSPVKPKLNPDDSRIEFVELAHNYGHAVTADKILSMSGWERAVLMGAQYALLNEMDFVYVEQDCVVSGSGWVDHCRKSMKKGKMMYGDGTGTPQRIQQSLFVVSLEFLPQFIQISQDPKTGGVNRHKNKKRLRSENPESRWFRYFGKHAEFLPFGTGRARPIPVNEKFFYAQHLTEEELKEIKKYEGFE